MPPAHHTKHIPLLELSFRSYTFALAQADDGAANGTALWLPGQVLAAFLASLPPPKSARPRAIELGSGIGFTALVLASLGWDVVATDSHPAVLSLLEQNVWRNNSDLPGSVTVRKLDWCVPPDEWNLEDVTTEPFDLVLTADTLYSPTLTPHLLRTLRHLACPPGNRSPILTYIAFERRDPALIDAALAELPDPARIPHRKLAKAMHAVGWGDWAADDWAGVEVWKVRWKDASLKEGRAAPEKEV
ncbi:hypothetical protein FRC09_011343 [Ceratobasidium sp. 395]|nr:hypothetical protein FRC09_011343 [Ceratobasidium sp. 395]